MDSPRGDITRLLDGLRSGDDAARSELLALIYPQLKKMAGNYMRRERPGHSLQTTELVNEAYLRLAGKKGNNWQNRAHFFAVASHVMREVLVDYARRSRTAKRGGGALQVDFEEVFAPSKENLDTLVDIDKALHRLAQWDARQAHVVTFRFFGGLTEEEIAEVLQISSRTVKRDWKMARAWLRGELKKQDVRHEP